ncbi:MAG: DegT/DnrJ/EryC1/StrS family aminotransferase [bacterium]|nr:DegT/DnrJ/EryC1/StrS family aminotransferase [bacterium]
MYYEVPQTTFLNILRNFFLPRQRELDFAVKEGYVVIPTASGKSAMHLVFEWLRFKGVLTSRMDEILVPQWMGAWIYKTMHSYAFPRTEFSPKTKVLWVYHQYGFPQNMDAIMNTARERNLVVVEDCAHALESDYKGHRLGTIGDFGIFSFSKFVPSLMGGAVVTNNKEARDFFLARVHRSRTRYAPFCFWSKYADESSHHARFAEELLKTSYTLYSYYVSMTRTVYNLIAGSLGLLNNRKKNYAIVKRVLKGNTWIDSLEEGVLPYVVPIHATPDKLSQIVQVIKDSHLYSGDYHFDKNRNLMNPQFIKVAWLPIHQNIPADVIEKVSMKIKNILA